MLFQAVVRAMDTMASFAKKQNPETNLTKFIVAGASKVSLEATLLRQVSLFLSPHSLSATTWTTGAVDKRVIGIIPIVMDLLNMSSVSLTLYCKCRYNMCCAYIVWTSSLKCLAFYDSTCRLLVSYYTVQCRHNLLCICT